MYKSVFTILMMICCITISTAQSEHEIISTELMTERIIVNTSNIGLAKSAHKNEHIYYPYEEQIALRSQGTTGIWLGTKSSDGEIKTAYSLYPQHQLYEYKPGVIDRSTGQAVLDEPFFDYIWKIEGHQIQQLISDHNEGTLTIDRIPNDILKWPAKGNPYLTEVDISYDLAPYLDNDGDGIYDPVKGDLPVALEINPLYIPSEWSFAVFVESSPSVMFTPKLHVEVQQIIYVNNCKQGLLANAVNHQWKITNLGTENIDSLYLGIFDGQDMGCPQCSYVGTHPETNSTFLYNRHSTEDGCDPNVDQSIKSNAIVEINLANRLLISSITQYNPLLDLPQDAYPLNYLKAKWQNDAPLTFGGTGYNEGSTDTVRFIYSDLPSTGGWIMEDQESNPFIQPTLISSYLLDELDAQQSKSFYFSKLMYAAPSMELSSLFEDYENHIATYTMSLQDIVDGDTDCQLVDISCTLDCVWPGDVNSDGIVNHHDHVYLSYANYLQAEGSSRAKIDYQWYGHISEDWESDILTINAKHADTDGDGSINLRDFLNIDKNYSKLNDSYLQEDEIPIEHLDTLGFGLSPSISDVDLSDLPNGAKTVFIQLTIGDEDLNIDSDLTGITFTMDIDDRVTYEALNLWPDLGDNDYHISIRDEQGMIIGLNEAYPPTILVSAASHSDQVINNGGVVVPLLLRIDPTFTTMNEAGRDTLRIKLQNLTAINTDGELVDVGIRKDLIIPLSGVPSNITSANNLPEASRWQLFPNPAKHTIQWSNGDANNTPVNVSIFSSTGVLCIDQIMTEQHFDLSILPSGMYYLELKTGETNVRIPFIKVE